MNGFRRIPSPGKVMKSPPFHDIDVEVCHIPNLCCVDIVLPLALAENVEVFKSPVVRGLVQYLWWEAAHTFEGQKKMLAATTLSLLTIGVGIGNVASDSTEHGWISALPIELSNHQIW